MASWDLHDGKAQIGPFEEEHVLRMIEAGLPVETLVRPVESEAWKSLRSHAPFAMALERAIASPTGGEVPRGAPVAAQPAQPRAAQAAKVKKSEFIGAGCVVQGLGFAAPGIGFFAMGPVGAVIGLVALLALFILGSRMATFYVCGACGSKLASPEATVCSACRAELVSN